MIYKDYIYNIYKLYYQNDNRWLYRIWNIGSDLMDLVFKVNLWLILAFLCFLVGLYNLNRYMDDKQKEHCKHSYVLFRECLNCKKKEIEDRDGGF